MPQFGASDAQQFLEALYPNIDPNLFLVWTLPDKQRLERALSAGRQARFEHGETPQPARAT